ncbi:hypothetical protein [Saccharicrinis fermentans]|uniref:Uncharacterized protein n=1 Tax=Saccharicrinis fermentans DSM 9555 = JCM 21142 TaxID=869213 RepID=W7Y1T7_9BACT|nr:hypothetical protein [Saccharicrinis fermentans]GAF04845.1 hypothetical protein JCM21142_93565 [Saccharicrinis fermentans DSM 9555 = JCM 21142]
MRTLHLNTQIRNTFMIILASMVLSTSASASASEITKMEPMPVEPVVSSNFDYLIDALNENNSEASLILEEWMLNPETFNLEDTEEPTLELETWMMDTHTFDVAFDSELTLEEWMTDLASFIDIPAEESLTLEEWMTNLDSFINEEPIFALDK